MVGDNRGAVVPATEMYPEADENFDEPITVLGDVHQEMPGLSDAVRRPVRRAEHRADAANADNHFSTPRPRSGLANAANFGIRLARAPRLCFAVC
jgi:hypothetical protein